ALTAGAADGLVGANHTSSIDRDRGSPRGREVERGANRATSAHAVPADGPGPAGAADRLILIENGAGQVYGRLPLNGQAAPGASAAWSASAAGPTHGGIAGQQAVDDRHRLLASDMDTAAHGGTSSPTSGARTPDDLIAHEAAVGDVEPSPIASETASDAG